MSHKTVYMGISANELLVKKNIWIRSEGIMCFLIVNSPRIIFENSREMKR